MKNNLGYVIILLLASPLIIAALRAFTWFSGNLLQAGGLIHIMMVAVPPIVVGFVLYKIYRGEKSDLDKFKREYLE